MECIALKKDQKRGRNQELIYFRHWKQSIIATDTLWTDYISLCLISVYGLNDFLS